MNAFVHGTKLQLSTRCSFGVMTQTRHKFPEFQSGKSVKAMFTHLDLFSSSGHNSFMLPPPPPPPELDLWLKR